MDRGVGRRRIWSACGFGKLAMIDLNAASAADLDAIPALRGHGPEIVRYREERGRFTSLRQLNEVPGLAGKADGLEDALSVGGQADTV